MTKRKTNQEPTVAERVKDAYVRNGSELSQREKEIVSKYYGLGGENRHTLNELGQKYGVTRERIRQIKSTALNKIGADVF